MNRSILRLAIPNILSNLTVPLLSSVDTALVGHLDQIYYLGAVAIGSMIFNALYWAFEFIRMGTTGITAQTYGQEDKGESIAILGRVALVAVSIGVLMILFRNLIAAVSFSLIDGSAEVEHYAREYFDIRIFAAPAALLINGVQGWWLGMQNAKYPLISALFINICNIALNIYFVRFLGMTADGVALGTLISQYLGLILCLILFLRKYKPFLKFLSSKRIFFQSAIKKFLVINGDIFIRTVCLIFVYSFFYAKSAAKGDTLLAVNSILFQLWIIMSYAIDGFAFAAESLIGKHIGQRDAALLRKAIRYLFTWSVGFGLFFAALYWFAGIPIINVFTNKSAVIELSRQFLVWTAIAPIISSVCYMWDGIFLGATATAAMRQTAIFCTFVGFLPSYWILDPLLGNHGLWLAFTIFMVLRGVTLAFYVKRDVIDQVK